MLLLGLFKLPVKNISENCARFNFVLRHLHLRTWVCTYSLWLCWAWGPHFIHRNCWPSHPMPPPGKHWSCRRTSVVPRLHPEFSLLPPVLGWQIHATGSPDLWQQCFRPVQEFAFQEGSRGQQLQLAVLLAEQTHLWAAPSQTVNANLAPSPLSWDTALPHIMIDWYEKIGFPTVFSLYRWWINFCTKIMCKTPLCICR